MTTIFNLRLLFRAQKKNNEDRPFNLTEIRERQKKKAQGVLLMTFTVLKFNFIMMLITKWTISKLPWNKLFHSYCWIALKTFTMWDHIVKTCPRSQTSSTGTWAFPATTDLPPTGILTLHNPDHTFRNRKICSKLPQSALS